MIPCNFMFFVWHSSCSVFQNEPAVEDIYFGTAFSLQFIRITFGNENIIFGNVK